MSHWEPELAPNGSIACGVVIPNGASGFAEADGNALLLGKAEPGKPFVHYFGAGWSKSGDFPDPAAWQAGCAGWPAAWQRRWSPSETGRSYCSLSPGSTNNSRCASHRIHVVSTRELLCPQNVFRRIIQPPE